MNQNLFIINSVGGGVQMYIKSLRSAGLEQDILDSWDCVSLASAFSLTQSLFRGGNGGERGQGYKLALEVGS